MATEGHHRCERCARVVVAVEPPLVVRAAPYAVLAFYVLLSFVIGASGTLLLGGGVIIFILGGLVLGPLHEQAAQPPRCPDCGRIVSRVPATS